MPDFCFFLVRYLSDFVLFWFFVLPPSLLDGEIITVCRRHRVKVNDRATDRPFFFKLFLLISGMFFNNNVKKPKLSKLHHHYHHPAMEHHLVPSRYSPTCSKQSKLQQMSLEPAVSLFLKVNDLFFYFFISWKCLRNYTPSLLFKM